MPNVVSKTDLRIAIVGPCGAGKTTLADGLTARDFNVREITQEHSYVPNMWKLLSKPHVLIYLDASFDTCNRRKQLDWDPGDHAEQIRRLAHARRHCNIYLATDDLTPEEIIRSVIQSLKGLAGQHPPG